MVLPQMAEIDTLSFEERLGLLVDREVTERENRRLKTRLKKARLRQSASVEDLDWRARRGLDKALVAKLTQSDWIEAKYNVLILGPDRGRQDVPGLRPGAQGLSQWLQRLLCPALAPVG